MEKIDILPAERLKRRIEYSGELAAIIELADSLGPSGRSMALRLITKKFQQTEYSDVQGSESSDSPLVSSGRS